MKFNCIVIDDEFHALAELTELINLHHQLNLSGSFLDINEAVAYLHSNGPVDIVFSDIGMPAISGIDAADILKKYSDNLIYVTAYREFALDAFSVGADGYLLKPVNRIDFFKRIDAILERSQKSKTEARIHDDHIFIKGDLKNTFIKIRYSEIVFIEGMLNYVMVHTTNVKEMTYMGLKDISEKLETQGNFLRINKSIIISMDYLERVRGNTVYLSTNQSFTIGNPYKNAFHEHVIKRAVLKH